MRKPRKTYKGHTFSIRVPEKVRYGLELLSRKKQVQMSTLVLRAIESMFEEEGLSESGQMFTLLDKLWSESPSQRLLAVVDIAPELATREEHRLAAMLRDSGIMLGKDADELLATLERHTGDVLDDAYVLGGSVLQLKIVQQLAQQFPSLVEKFGSAENILQWLKEGLAK